MGNREPVSDLMGEKVIARILTHGYQIVSTPNAICRAWPAPEINCVDIVYVNATGVESNLRFHAARQTTREIGESRCICISCDIIDLKDVESDSLAGLGGIAG